MADQDETIQPSLRMIGHVRTGFETLRDCPRSTLASPDDCFIELEAKYLDGLQNSELASHLIILYWLDQADRDGPVSGAGCTQPRRGVFISRSPNRPNPIGLSVVKNLGFDGTLLTVSGLDCRNGTPILDIKPYSPEIDTPADAWIKWEVPGAPKSTSKETV